MTYTECPLCIHELSKGRKILKKQFTDTLHGEITENCYNIKVYLVNKEKLVPPNYTVLVR
jgi:hypothetical protein